MQLSALSTSPITSFTTAQVTTPDLVADTADRLKKVALSDPDLYSLMEERLSNSPRHLIDSHRPFKIVEFMAQNFSHSFVINALKKTSYIESKYYSSDSCINVLYALGVIFFGSDKTHELMKFLTKHQSQSLKLVLKFPIIEKQEKISYEYTYKYKIDNLFWGAIIQLFDTKIQNIQEDQVFEKENIQESIETALSPYYKHIMPIIRACEKVPGETADEKRKKIDNIIENAFANLDYDFNRTTVDFLNDEVQKNVKRVNCKSSFIYFINMAEDQQFIHHAFAIEQFFDVDTDKVRYRLYQAWSGEMDLKRFFQKRNYDAKGAGCLSHEEFQDFLCDLEIFLCKTPLDSEHIFAAHERCFGVQFKVLPDLSYYEIKPNESTIKGLSFRYISRNINPNDCLKNFISFVERVPELETEVRQSLTNQLSNRN